VRAIGSPSHFWEGAGGWGRARRSNRQKHAFDIPQHFVVPEPQHHKALRLDPHLPLHVARATMLPAIDLHDQSPLSTNQIANERSNGDLPTELPAVELPPS